jgi:hypothetical protein
MGTYKIGELPLTYRPRVLLLGEIPQNTCQNIKGVGVIYIYI